MKSCFALFLVFALPLTGAAHADNLKACQGALLVVSQRQDMGADSSLQLSDVLSSMDSEASSNAEQLLAEIETLISKTKIFSSGLFATLYTHTMGGRINFENTAELAAAHVPAFYLYESSRKLSISRELTGKILNLYSSASSYSAETLGLSTLEWLAEQRFWREYSVADPGLYKLELAILVYMQFHSEKLAHQLKPRSFLAGWSKKQPFQFGRTFELAVPSAQGIPIRDALLTRDSSHKIFYSDDPAVRNYAILRFPNSLDLSRTRALIGQGEQALPPVVFSALQAREAELSGYLQRLEPLQSALSSAKQQVDELEARLGEAKKKLKAEAQRHEELKKQEEQIQEKIVNLDPQARALSFDPTGKDYTPIENHLLTSWQYLSKEQVLYALFQFVSAFKFDQKEQAHQWVLNMIYRLRALSKLVSLQAHDKEMLFDRTRAKIIFYLKAEELDKVKDEFDPQGWGRPTEVTPAELEGLKKITSPELDSLRVRLADTRSKRSLSYEEYYKLQDGEIKDLEQNHATAKMAYDRALSDYNTAMDALTKDAGR
jgi:hypothetical protein